jgi:hypothetical protein
LEWTLEDQSKVGIGLISALHRDFKYLSGRIQTNGETILLIMSCKSTDGGL